MEAWGSKYKSNIVWHKIRKDGLENNGNRSAQNLFGVLAALQKAEAVSVELQMHAQ